MLLGVDTGGTFTDFVLLADGGIRIHKVLSTPEAPERAILQGIDELQLTDEVRRGKVTIVHGSTVATNAALEGKGVRTVYIANHGLGDVLTIGRQTRDQLYNLTPDIPAPPVPRELCLETGGRLSASGELLEPLTEADLQQLQQQVAALKPDAVAINLLFSFLDDSQEKRIEKALPDHLFISRSSFVLPEYKEYERGMATWLNAWLGPLVENYLQRLQQSVAPAPLAVMQSSGGTIDATQASQRAVNLLLSGPAGGLAAAKMVASVIAKTSGSSKIMTFDMGGTSTDVALIDGELKLTSEGYLGPYPVAVPMVDMHTIGAGGGSIAYLDKGKMLRVGPQSAGATPGPACYGQGGTLATVTDANAVLGRLQPDNFLGGKMLLDLSAATSALTAIGKPLNLSAEAASEGVLQIANEHMVRALRAISVQRGYNPADFRLCCFGGAGGLHVCALAEALNMRTALIPIFGGVLSALGMLVAPRERQLSHAQQQLLSAVNDSQINQWLQALVEEGQQQLVAEGVASADIQHQFSLDLRYQGQTYTINTPWQGIEHTREDYHQRHQQSYGHRLELPLELVNVRARVFANNPPIDLPTLKQSSPAQPKQRKLYGVGETALYQREELAAGQLIDGPALICEPIATTFIAPNWQANVDGYGNLLLTHRH